MTTALFVAVQPVLCRLKQQLQITPLDTERSCFFFSGTFSPCFSARWRTNSTFPLRRQLPCNVFHHSLIITLIFFTTSKLMCSLWRLMGMGSHWVATIPPQPCIQRYVESILIPFHTDLTERLLPAAPPNIHFSLDKRSAIERTNKCIDSNRLWCNHGTIQQLLTEKILYSNQWSCYEYTKATILAFH